MATNVTPDEARALAQALASESGEARPAAHVESRQFDRPQRLSTAERSGLREKLRRALPEIARELAPSMRGSPPIELVELGEAHADTVHEGLIEPFAVARFEVAGQPGWLVWDCAAALAMLDVALGAAEPGKTSARPFTSIERAMFPRAVQGALARIGNMLGLQFSAATTVQTFDSLGHWRQGGDKAEPQRLLITLSVAGPGGPSTWRVYVPGIVHSERVSARTERPAPLPAHLNDVLVELRAHLGANEVPLAELLALEVGDVIPLKLALGDSLSVLVEDQACLRATIGRSQGRLALRVLSVERPKPEA